jgi:hypothetical protein
MNYIYTGTFLLLFIVKGLSEDVIPVGFPPNRYITLEEKNPFFNTIVPVKTSAKFVLLSWYKDIGEKIFIQDKDTKVVQEVDNVPNKDHWSIISFHNDPDPHLVEVVISNGFEKQTVKFDFDVKVPEENKDNNNLLKEERGKRR